ncbi:hypothetical protein [Nocardia arthritidis]|uniref:Secreted protein n=1 Tax=Nocardia arthritidis TaxID=228602 RepID=A0A6G9YK03_9NOCA|nr:hypothetical protein [Nocardia arthritidis]QIS13524.1 hypothetical protein F5544_28360 [Nocardia arthritidis]
MGNTMRRLAGVTGLAASVGAVIALGAGTANAEANLIYHKVTTHGSTTSEVWGYSDRQSCEARVTAQSRALFSNQHLGGSVEPCQEIKKDRTGDPAGNPYGFYVVQNTWPR